MNLKDGEDCPVVNGKNLSIRKDALTLNVGRSSPQIMKRSPKKMGFKNGEERPVVNEKDKDALTLNVGETSPQIMERIPKKMDFKDVKKDLSIELDALYLGGSSPQIMEHQKHGDVDLLNEKDQDQDIRKNKILHIELFL